MFHFLPLKLLFLENYFVIFPVGFSLLGVAENVEKNVVSMWHEFILASQVKSGPSLAAPYF